MTQLMHLAYLSKSNLGNDLASVEDNVRQILEIARENNARLSVTGALLYSGGYFCQIIEGEDEPLTDLFESIQLDPRHSDVAVLYYEPIATRSFAEWSMAFAGIEEKRRFNIEGILASTDELAIKQAGHAILMTLRDLVTQHQSVLTDH